MAIERLRKCLLESAEQGAVAVKQACLQKIGFDRDVFACFTQTILDGAHAMAHFEANVPQIGDETFELRDAYRIRLTFE